MKVLVLGAGKMVEAILTGLKEEMDLSHFYLFSPTGESAKNLAKKVGCQHIIELDEKLKPDFVWLGCKPQQLKQVSLMLGHRFSQTTFVSMLAALPEEDQCRVLKIEKLIRIMPNLAVKFKKGVTLISSQSAQDQLKKIQSIFSTLGIARLVEESELEELTLLTGSGPAFIYEFSKILSGSFASLTSVEREELVRMVLQGASESVAKDPIDFNQLTHAVTSKGGVTIAVLEEWRHRDLAGLMKSGIDAGKKRSMEIRNHLLHS